MNWLLDDGPLDDLARQFDSKWVWPASTLHVVGAVARAAERSPARTTLLNMASRASPCIRVHTIVVGTPAEKILRQHLRPRFSVAPDDLGEHEAIALCAAQEHDLVFVANDKRATYLALAELGPRRVATPFDVWADLQERSLITADRFDALCQQSVKRAGLERLPRRCVRQA